MWSTANVIDDLRNHRQVCAKVIIIENALQQCDEIHSSDDNIDALKAQYHILYTKKSGITCPAGQVWHNADKVGGHVNGYDNDTKNTCSACGS